MTKFESEKHNVGDGWQPIIEQLHKDLLKIDPNYQLGQIKEKFGGLRYYVSSQLPKQRDHDKISQLIEAAEREAERTCEICGKPGSTTEIRSWYATRCEAHR